MSADLEIKVDEDQDIQVVEVTDPASPGQQGEPPKRVEADLGVDELKRQVDAQRAESQRLAREKEEADRRAGESAQQIQTLQRQKVDGEYHIIVNAISATQQETAALKRDMKEAYERGDIDAFTDLQEKLADSRYKLNTLTQGKDAIEARLRAPQAQPTHQGRVADQQPVQTQQPGQPTARTQAFLQKHAESFKDQGMWNKAMAAHYDALAENHVPDSDAYFDYIERRTGLGGGGRDLAPAQTRDVARRPSSVAAPVSREGTSMTTGRRTGGTVEVTLTAAEREIAKLNGLTDKEYATNKLALIREGKLSA